MTPRNRRLLALLCERDSVTVRELRVLIGALNPAQNAHELRKQGWEIVTEREELKDRDGLLCRPGRYRMEAPEKDRARKLLNELESAENESRQSQSSRRGGKC